MHTPGAFIARRGLLFVAIVTLAVACADSTKRMTRVPSEGGPPRGGEARDTVVLFKVSVYENANAIPGMLSTLPRWKWHYLVNVGSGHEPVDSGDAFGAGQLDATAREAGWGFVTLPKGTYQLAFAAYRTRFDMPGAYRGSLGFGQSSASQLEVPPDAELLYAGTFAFTCHKVDRWWGYIEHECTNLEIRNEEELALRIASSSLSRFGPMRTTLASAIPIEPPR